MWTRCVILWRTMWTRSVIMWRTMWTRCVIMWKTMWTRYVLLCEEQCELDVLLCEEQCELGVLLCEYFQYFQNSSFYDGDLYHMTFLSEKYKNENLPFCDVIWHFPGLDHNIKILEGKFFLGGGGGGVVR